MTTYFAKVSREDPYWLVEFPDCPGCQSFAYSALDLDAVALEALDGWIKSEMCAGRVPPEPRAKGGPDTLAVSVLLTFDEE